MKDRYPKCVKKVYTFLSAVTIDPGWWGNAWHRRAGTRGCAPGSRARKSGERWLLVEALHVSKWGKPEINNTVINWILELSLCSGGSVRSYVNYEILKFFAFTEFSSFSSSNVSCEHVYSQQLLEVIVVHICTLLCPLYNWSLPRHTAVSSL